MVTSTGERKKFEICWHFVVFSHRHIVAHGKIWRNVISAMAWHVCSVSQVFRSLGCMWLRCGGGANIAASSTTGKLNNKLCTLLYGCLFASCLFIYLFFLVFTIFSCTFLRSAFRIIDFFFFINAVPTLLLLPSPQLLLLLLKIKCECLSSVWVNASCIFFSRISVRHMFGEFLLVSHW